MTLVVPLEEVFADKSGLLASPSWWERVELGEVCEVLNGYPFKSKLFNRSNGLPVIRIRDLEKGRTETRFNGDVEPEYVVENGDILVGMDGLFRCHEWSGGRAGLNQRVCKLIPDERFLLKRYLLYVLPGYLQAIQDATSSVTVGHLSSRDILRIPLPLPSLCEQRRLVTTLDNVVLKSDQCRQRLDRIPDLLRRFRQSVLAAACSGKLTEDWREVNLPVESTQSLVRRIVERRAATVSGTVKSRRKSDLSPSDYLRRFSSLRSDLDLFELPDGWMWVDLEFLMDPEEAFCYGVVQPGKEVFGGPRLIRVCDLESGTVKTDGLRSISPEIHDKYSRSTLKGGELLVSVVGTIGRSAIAPPGVAGANIARAVAKLPIREFDSAYVLSWLSTSVAQAWMIQDAREVARKTLNLEQLKTLPVPLPAPREQTEISRRVGLLLSLAGQIESRYQKAKTQVDKLTPAILAKAFCGELVPQDPNDEPAEKLLERIRAERANGPEKIRKGRKSATRKTGPSARKKRHTMK